MEQYPKPNKDQLKRLREYMVKVGFATSLADARKKTETLRQQKERAIKCLTLGDPENDGLGDLSELYVIDDEPVEQEPAFKPIEEKQEDRIEETKPRLGRGKGKNPVKRVTSVALEPDLYSELEQVSISEERSIGAVIRIAIKAFLESRKGGTV